MDVKENSKTSCYDCRELYEPLNLSQLYLPSTHIIDGSPPIFINKGVPCNLFLLPVSMPWTFPRCQSKYRKSANILFTTIATTNHFLRFSSGKYIYVTTHLYQ